MVSFEDINDDDHAVLSGGDPHVSKEAAKPAPVPSRLPTVGETVEIQGLLSSPHLNGKRGEISSYVRDRDIHRYKVKVRRTVLRIFA